MRAKKSKGRKGERERERCRWQRSSMWLRSQVKCSPTSRIMCSTTTSTRHGEAKLGKHNMPLCCRHVVDHVCVDCQQRPLFCTRTPYTPAHLAHLHTLHASFWFGDLFFFFQLEKACVIPGGDVGNYGAAFVEVLVARTGSAEPEYKVRARKELGCFRLPSVFTCTDTRAFHVFVPPPRSDAAACDQAHVTFR